MSSESASSKKHRRWPRFTLRILLATVTLLCIGLGIWTYRSREQARIVDSIRAAGGIVQHRHQFVSWRVANSLGEDFCYPVFGAVLRDGSAIRELPKLRRLKNVEIDCELLSDADIEPIRHVSGLRMLCVDADEGQRFNPDSETHGQSRIGDASLEWIGAMPRLACVRLDAQFITSKGINALAQSSSLQIVELYCEDASVDAESLAAIQGNKRLTALRIWRNTPSGWEKTCEWDPKHAFQ